MTAPVANGAAVAQSTAAIESQAAIVGGMSTSAQNAAAAYVLAAAGHDEESWYSTDHITAMATGVGRVVDSFTVNVARYVDGFIADTVAVLSGRKFRPVGVRNVTGLAGEISVRGDGVTTAGVIGRAADTYRYQQSLLDKQFIADVNAGATVPTELASPLDAAVTRVRRGTQMNLALAGRNQARATLSAAAGADLITGYRRVLHAELAEEGSCGLCIAASTRVYRVDHLMPMHPGCHCIPVPISKRSDPGAAINDADLARFYDEAGGTSVADLRATRYKVDEHGELGPVLRPHDDPIRTEQQARRDTNRAKAKSDAEKIKTLRNKRDVLVRSHARVSAGQTDPAWAKRLDDIADRIARLDRQIVKLGS